MLSNEAVLKLVQPFGAYLSHDQAEQMLVYMDLLLRWNRKINLTAIRTPEECITRHFGESFLLANAIPVSGSLLDVGSGAGFPGLALKLLCPQIMALLLEPVGKKRAFLKEVINVCRLDSVSVSGTTIQEFSRQPGREPFDIATVRAVGKLDRVIPGILDCLKTSGYLCLWVGQDQTDEIVSQRFPVEWKDPIPIPMAERRQILIGRKLYIS